MISRILSFFVILSLLLGCASKPKVTTDFNPSYNFSNLKTFFIQDTKTDNRENILISPFTFNHIHDLLNAELAKRYQSVAEEKSADFWVTYHVVLEEKLDPRVYDDLYGFGYWGRGPRYPSPFFARPAYTTSLNVYSQGSLIVDLIDAKTNQPIWRGVSEKRLSKGLTPQQQREVLAGALLEVLAQFPPVK